MSKLITPLCCHTVSHFAHVPLRDHFYSTTFPSLFWLTNANNRNFAGFPMPGGNTCHLFCWFRSSVEVEVPWKGKVVSVAPLVTCRLGTVLEILRQCCYFPLWPSQGFCASTSWLVFDNLCRETLIGSPLPSFTVVITALVDVKDWLRKGPLYAYRNGIMVLHCTFNMHESPSLSWLSVVFLS